jgi:hypothetical protein
MPLDELAGKNDRKRGSAQVAHPGKPIGWIKEGRASVSADDIEGMLGNGPDAWHFKRSLENSAS